MGVKRIRSTGVCCLRTLGGKMSDFSVGAHRGAGLTLVDEILPTFLTAQALEIKAQVVGRCQNQVAMRTLDVGCQSYGFEIVFAPSHLQSPSVLNWPYSSVR